MVRVFPIESPHFCTGKDLRDRGSDSLPHLQTREGSMEFFLLSMGIVNISYGDVETLEPVRWQGQATPFRLPFPCIGGSGNFQLTWNSVPYY